MWLHALMLRALTAELPLRSLEVSGWGGAEGGCSSTALFRALPQSFLSLSVSWSLPCAFAWWCCLPAPKRVLYSVAYEGQCFRGVLRSISARYCYTPQTFRYSADVEFFSSENAFVERNEKCFCLAEVVWLFSRVPLV